MREMNDDRRGQASTRPVSILLVEGNRLLREGLAGMIRQQEDFKILAAIGDRDSVFEHVQRLKPRVVLLDLGLRKQDDQRLVDQLTREHPEVKIIVMDLLPTQADVFVLVRAGVSGFILKDATFDDVLTTVRLVDDGTNVLPQPLTGPLFSDIVNHDARRANALQSYGSTMTRREREIIRLIADGLSNKEIAQRLNVATFTVKSHVHNVLEKLTLRTRAQIASYYVKEGTSSGTVAAD
jgi:DNA-binding NarL/FixJ family response regulator